MAKDFVEEAIISYRHAIDLNPEYDAAYNNLGAVYLDGKQMYHEAKDCFMTAIEKIPNTKWHTTTPVVLLRN